MLTSFAATTPPTSCVNILAPPLHCRFCLTCKCLTRARAFCQGLPLGPTMPTTLALHSVRMLATASLEDRQRVRPRLCLPRSRTTEQHPDILQTTALACCLQQTSVMPCVWAMGHTSCLTGCSFKLLPLWGWCSSALGMKEGSWSLCEPYSVVLPICIPSCMSGCHEYVWLHQMKMRLQILSVKGMLVGGFRFCWWSASLLQLSVCFQLALPPSLGGRSCNLVVQYITASLIATTDRVPQ